MSTNTPNPHGDNGPEIAALAAQKAPPEAQNSPAEDQKQLAEDQKQLAEDQKQDQKHANPTPASPPGPPAAAASSGFGTSEKNSLAADDERKKLSTSSPEAIRVAAQITPNRLANLLIRKGPLAIRLITAHLSAEVPGFDLLSLSKQRRLIMAAMEHGDTQNNVVFEKIGWGQWAVRDVNSDYIVTEPNAAQDKSRLNIHELREKAKLGWSKKAGAEAASADSHRRDSISNHRSNLHNVTVPGERHKLHSAAVHESAVSDSEPDSDSDGGAAQRMADDDSSDAMADDDDDDLFAFDDDVAGGRDERRFKRSPPIKFANRVPTTKFSPPPILSGNRRKSSSSVVKNTASYNSTRHPQILNRSRLNSMENLDEYMFSSARNSSISVASPPAQAHIAGAMAGFHVASVPTTSPLGSWNGTSQDVFGARDFSLSSENVAALGSRRKSSFNESSLRSTLSSSLPRHRAPEHVMYADERPTLEVASDTDEEDWASMGAESLRSGGDAMAAAVPTDESTAARALVNLMST